MKLSTDPKNPSRFILEARTRMDDGTVDVHFPSHAETGVGFCFDVNAGTRITHQVREREFADVEWDFAMGCRSTRFVLLDVSDPGGERVTPVAHSIRMRRPEPFCSEAKGASDADE